jgi:hypothetical protein
MLHHFTKLISDYAVIQRHFYDCCNFFFSFIFFLGNLWLPTFHVPHNYNLVFHKLNSWNSTYGLSLVPRMVPKLYAYEMLIRSSRKSFNCGNYINFCVFPLDFNKCISLFHIIPIYRKSTRKSIVVFTFEQFLT